MISVIVPIYNVERYLPACIESILRQTYGDIELLLVDDGSPDGCALICDDYAAKDRRITVIHKKNAGVSSARNAGLDRAGGDFIGFVDPDDHIRPTMYEEMLSAMERTGADLAVCGYNYTDEDGNEDTERLYPEKETELLTHRELVSRFADMPPTVRLSVCNKLFRRETVGELKFEEGLHSSEDVLFLNEYAKSVCRTAFVHKPLYMNTVRSGSATHGALNIGDLSDSFKAHDKMYGDTVSLYPELKAHCLAFLMDICVLKYNEARSKLNMLAQDEQTAQKARLGEMKKYIQKRAVQAVFDREIYRNTRIGYLKEFILPDSGFGA